MSSPPMKKAMRKPKTTVDAQNLTNSSQSITSRQWVSNVYISFGDILGAGGKTRFFVQLWDEKKNPLTFTLNLTAKKTYGGIANWSRGENGFITSWPSIENILENIRAGNSNLKLPTTLRFRETDNEYKIFYRIIEDYPPNITKHYPPKIYDKYDKNDIPACSECNNLLLKQSPNSPDPRERPCPYCGKYIIVNFRPPKIIETKMLNFHRKPREFLQPNTINIDITHEVDGRKIKQKTLIKALLHQMQKNSPHGIIGPFTLKFASKYYMAVREIEKLYF